MLFRRHALLVISLCMVSASAFAAAPVALRVGVAKVDITPTDMALNAVGPNPWVDVHDPIFARALVISNGAETTAFVSLDLVDFPTQINALRERIQREVGIAVDHQIISVTHDHSAPHFSGDAPACQPDGPQGGPCAMKQRMQAYTDSTSERIIEALKQAKAALQPARMGLGTGSADVSVSRDLYTAKGWGMGFNAAGPSDKTVWVVKFETPSGEPIAMLFNYAVHSIVTMDTLQVSGDLAGDAEHLVEQHYGGKYVALYTMGAAGDQNPKFPAFPPPQSRDNKDVAAIRALAYRAMDAQGFMLGAEVLRVADLINANISAPRIVAADSTFSCPVRPDPRSGSAEGVVPIQLSLLRIDQIAFVGVSGEVVTNIYSHLRKASPLTDTILITIANGRVGYLVDDAAYDEPIFEVHASPAARNCAESGIVDGLVKLIEEHP